MQNRYPDARQLPPTPDESAIALKAPSATHSYPALWKDGYVAHDQRYDAQRLSAVAGSYADASYHPPRPDQRHTPPSGTTTATSPPGQRIAGSWQSLPLSPHAHQNHISSAPLTVQIPESQGESITPLPRPFRVGQFASARRSFRHPVLTLHQHDRFATDSERQAFVSPHATLPTTNCYLTPSFLFSTGTCQPYGRAGRSGNCPHVCSTLVLPMHKTGTLGPRGCCGRS